MEKKTKFSIWYVMVAIWGILILQNLFFSQFRPRDISYSEFLQKLEEGKIVEVSVQKDKILGKMVVEEDNVQKTVNFYTVRVDLDLSRKLAQYNVKFRGEPESTLLLNLFSWFFPILFFFGLWYLLVKRMRPEMGMMAFGKTKAKLYAEEEIPTRFDDVAGADEAKMELQEIVEFLKDPKRFQQLGGRMPKGVLLVGPPGTGKTLLARAVAGESGVPFFSISGSDFVELFVGMGAARVRDLFSQARTKAPCIIFIDELDAIGKVRNPGIGGGHDEREQTLNQLLVEMDGFDHSSGVVILGATNRPETLDPALLRAGRFDRHILVDRPDVAGREAILRVHAKNVRLAPDVDLKVVAQRTPGFSGADLANAINEAALLAARKRKQQVDMQDIEEAVDRITAGLEKKNRVINPKEKEIVAYHETGHALVAAFTPGADKVHKISIIPRGIGALGYTQQLPTEDRYLMTRQELLGKIDVLLGGRVAELLVFGDSSTGAHNDLQRATEIARAMVCEYGMGKTLGLATFPRRNQPLFLTRDQMPLTEKEYSEATAAKVDEEIKEILHERESRVKAILNGRRDLMEKIAKRLLETEVIEADEFQQLLAA